MQYNENSKVKFESLDNFIVTIRRKKKHKKIGYIGLHWFKDAAILKC